jgi:hypothetical protein
MTFIGTEWKNVVEPFILQETGCKAYSGAGINPRVKQKTTILRSVDDTYYYKDNLNNLEELKYTLFGHDGDQDRNEPKFNEPFLNPEKTHHIFLYRVKKVGKRREYYWYGKCKIISEETIQHRGKLLPTLRNIIIITLKQI